MKAQEKKMTIEQLEAEIGGLNATVAAYLSGKGEFDEIADDFEDWKAIHYLFNVGDGAEKALLKCGEHAKDLQEWNWVYSNAGGYRYNSDIKKLVGHAEEKIFELATTLESLNWLVKNASCHIRIKVLKKIGENYLR